MSGKGREPLELLNAQAHRQLRAKAASGEGRHFVQVVPAEVARIATRAPVLMTKHPETGAFYLGAVFGFTPGENLLVNCDGTLDATMPLDWERDGFFVEGDSIAIEPTHPRLVGGEGRALFDEDGQPSDALRRVQRALALLAAGLRETETAIAALLALKLVEPIDVSLSFDDGQRMALDGLYTVSRDALAGLPDAEIARLFRAGHLQLALTMADSLNQIPLLARRRNDRLTA
jgi:hypothetical protein